MFLYLMVSIELEHKFTKVEGSIVVYFCFFEQVDILSLVKCLSHLLVIQNDPLLL